MVLWIDVWDSGSTDCFVCMRLFGLRLCAVHLLCAFRAVTDAFVSLYVSEFLTSACGVSPLRGRLKDSALKNPAALERLANFLASGAGLWVLFT